MMNINLKNREHFEAFVTSGQGLKKIMEDILFQRKDRQIRKYFEPSAEEFLEEANLLLKDSIDYPVRSRFKI